MDPVVLVPRRPEPWRDGLWRFVRREVEEELGWPIVEGFGDPPSPIEEVATPEFPVRTGQTVPSPFNRSACLNRAGREAGGWMVAVILDADTVPDFGNLRQGVEAAERHGTLVLPHTRFWSLSKEATRSVLAGELDVSAAAARWVTPETKSSCLCVRRDLWEQTGGFDERFTGWGFEDAAFYAACQALAGITRLSGPVHHLWHPRSGEKNPKSPAYIENRERGERYKAARRDPDAMQEILGEPGGPLDV